jgi:hypothetical protein
MNIGRNEPCYCKSGLKYKKCCLVKDEQKRQEILQKSRELTGDNLAEYMGGLGLLKEYFNIEKENEEDDSEFQEWWKQDLEEGQRNLQLAKEEQVRFQAHYHSLSFEKNTALPLH